MEQFKITKSISFMCSIISFMLSSNLLIISLQSIGETGWEALGVLLIIPSAILFLVVLFDFLITLGKIKKGVTYSCVGSIMKISLIPMIIDANGGIDSFVILIIISLIIITIPSVLNFIRLIYIKKK